MFSTRRSGQEKEAQIAPARGGFCDRVGTRVLRRRSESAADGGVVFGEVSRVFRRNVDGKRHNVGEHATNGTSRVLDDRNDGRRYV